MGDNKVEINNGRWFIECDCGARVEVGTGDGYYSWSKACRSCGNTIQVWEDKTYSINRV